jgi:hypothetical protein
MTAIYVIARNEAISDIAMITPFFPCEGMPFHPGDCFSPLRGDRNDIGRRVGTVFVPTKKGAQATTAHPTT